MTQRVFYDFDKKLIEIFGPQWVDTIINNYYNNINKYGNPTITALYMSQKIKLIYNALFCINCGLIIISLTLADSLLNNHKISSR